MALGEPWSVEGQEPGAQEATERASVRLVSPASDRAAAPPSQQDQQTAQRVEAVLARLNQRLDRTEVATFDAIEGLKSAFARVSAPTTGALGDRQSIEHRFETLARDLHEQVEDVRTELLESLKSTTDARFGQVARALEAMGLHMQSAERRSSAALEQMGADIARLGGAMDQRLGRYETVQSDALQKLSFEIDRIAERLSDRISHSERRSSQAVMDARDEFAQQSDAVADRTLRATSDLSERIRQSEERTARLLDEARAKLDQRLVPAAASVEPRQAEPETVTRQAAAAQTRQINPFMAMEPLPVPDEAQAAWDLTEWADGLPLEMADRFDEEVDGPIDGPTGGRVDASDDEDDGAGFFSAGLAAELAAKINARQAELADTTSDPLVMAEIVRPEPQRGPEPSAERALELASAAPPSAPDADPTWKVTEGEHDRLFAPAPPKARRSRRRPSLASRKTMVASLAILSVGLSIVGLAMLGAESQNLSPRQAFEAMTGLFKGGSKAPAPVPSAAQMPGADPTAAPLHGAPVAAAQTQQAKGDMPAAATQAGPSQSPVLSGDFADLRRHLSAKDSSGLPKLKQMAQEGYAPAQAYLGKLYEVGDLGLAKDLGAARRWTEQAARSGDVEAMHRMGLYHYYGQGGAQNLVVAAQWFRRAAERGMLDSQYNLAQLYETGLGVSANGAEAYRWYLIAAQSGDEEALKKVAALKAALPADARANVERQVRAFRVQP